MKKIRIIALHLAFGGIEKAICSMANLFAERYEVEILSVYHMPDSPAFPLDDRVKVTWLLDEIPNREAWKAALRGHDLPGIARESFRAARILRDKKRAVVEAVEGAEDGVVITTRPEDNVLLSRHGRPGALKIAQLHRDHAFEKELVRSIKKDYGGVDIFALLTPGLRDEVREMMRGNNAHTECVYMPNFLEHFPDDPSKYPREKSVLAVGRLHEVKRFDLLIRLFHCVRPQFPDWTLRIVGEGEERQKLEDTIRELGAEDYVNLTGKKDAAGVEEEMLRASVFAMTSRSEGFPFVLLEAQSCGLPIVAFDVRVGPGFVVQNGINGSLAPEGDEACFCEKLAALMGDEILCRRMSDAAIRRAAEFSKEKVGEMWYSLIGD
ncbi:MAG: glycosyltransferase [Oscillospiraceae bacterium]|nr:glycosyltransferase [Oscillospiraceae bacterium]